MEKTRKIQSIIQDVIEGRKDNNEATIDILALCVVSHQRELLLDFMKKLDRNDIEDLKDKYFDRLADWYLSNNCG